MARRDRKSADAFRTISEVADDVDVPQHVLRFWETKFPQIKPLKRGGGRRYYRPEDVDLIRKVRNWLYDDGYTIKGVQKLLREGAATDENQPDEGAADVPAPEARITEAGTPEAHSSGSHASVAPTSESHPGAEPGDTVSTASVLAAIETAGAADLDDTARAAIGKAIGELERIRDRLRLPDR